MKRKGEEGQAMLLVIATGIFVIGALGLALDGAQLYAQYHKAQAGADAAAQAAAMSILAGTNAGTNAFGSASFNCTNGSDVRTPCLYAQSNGFAKAGSSDVVAVDFPTSVSGVALSPDFSHAAVHVTITRTVSTVLLRLLGPSSSNITAGGTAAIVQTTSPIPILVLDLTASGALNLQGTPTITICGGPQESIQVNSQSYTAVTVGGSATVDLSKGGPNDSSTSPCTTGTGSNLGTFGGPPSNTLPSWMTPSGSTESYKQPSFPIRDPFLTVNAPSNPGPAPTPTTITSGNHGCPATTCTLYPPGQYSFIDVKGDTAVFEPGVYYINGSKKISGVDTGFGNEANGNIMMCTDCSADTTTNGTGNTGMMVYLSSSAGTLNIGANASAAMVGSSSTSVWKGMLFYMDRSSANLNPNLGGGGAMTLQGTIYLPTQNFTFQGHTGSSTVLKGDIVVDELSLGGNGSITMQLDPNYMLPLDTVALVK